MYRLLIFSSLSWLLFSCKEKPKEEFAVIKGRSLTVLPVQPERVKGLYAGAFKGSPISIVLDYVSNRHVSGYNVHNGLMRNISGTVKFRDGRLHLQLAEPGNNPHDGQFDLVLDTLNWSGKGVWKPFKKGEETSFTFKKKIRKEGEADYDLTFMDSLSNYITLKPNGTCTYSYLTDTTKTGQQITIRGNHEIKNNTVTIFWQKNNVFPAGRSVFKLVDEKPEPDADYTVQSLKGEGRVFSEMMF